MDIVKHIHDICPTINNANIIHSINGIVLYKTSDDLFRLHEKMYEEVSKYCSSNNIQINKVVFITSYDAPVPFEMDEAAKKAHLNMDSEDKLTILEDEDGNKIAYVYMVTHLDIHNDL